MQTISTNFEKKSTTIISIILLALLLFSSTLVQADEWVYSTRPGDTIWDISKKHLKSVTYWTRVQKHNNVDIAKQLAPGTRLRIPLEWLKTPATTATIVSASGEVQLESAETGQISTINSKQTINYGDSIQTGDNSSALVQFADGSTLLLQKNTHVIFNTISSYGQTGMVDTRLRLQQGRVETSVRPQGKSGSRYEITTPAAVAAVRGTQFRVAYTPDQKTMGSEVVEGNINVAAENLEQPVRQGFGTITEQGKPPREPVKLLEKPDLDKISNRIRFLPFNLEWQALNGAVQYRIQLSPGNTPETLVYEQTSNTNQHSLNNISDGDYILRIRGIDKSGLEGFNAEHILNIDTNFPEVNLSSPVMNDELTEPPYTFNWQTTKVVENYHIQISTDTDFSNLIFDDYTESTSLTLNDKLPLGTYYWRVAAIDTDGSRGKFSQIESFIVDENRYELLLILLYILPAFLI